MLRLLRYGRSGLLALLVVAVLGCGSTPTSAPNKSNAAPEQDKGKAKVPGNDPG